jgi:hypothetical protein
MLIVGEKIAFIPNNNRYEKHSNFELQKMMSSHPYYYWDRKEN